LIGVHQLDERCGEAFCAIGAPPNCPGKALSLAGKGKSFARKPFCSARKASRFAPQGFDPCVQGSEACA
jgi:hypothetical protein